MDDFARHCERAYLDLLEEGTIDKTVDKLPYTRDFDFVYEAVVEEYPEKSEEEVFQRLVTLRKQGFCKSKEKTQEEKDRLTFTQVKILRILERNPRGLTRAQIERKYGRKIGLTAALGPLYIDDLDKSEERYKHSSLMGLDYVNVSQPDPDSKTCVYTISEAGRKALKVLDS